MRKIRVLAGVLLAVAIAVPGLAPASTGLTKGIKVGLNMASVSGGDSDPKLMTGNSGATKDPVMGVVGGIFLGIGLGPLNLQGEALYSQKGVKYAWGGNSHTASLAYLDIPVVFKYDLLPGPVSISVFAGPSLGILLSAKAKTEVGGASVTVDTKDSTNASDLGAVVGAGVSLPMGLTADIRYQMGLSKLGKDVGGVAAAKIYNSVITLMVGKSF